MSGLRLPDSPDEASETAAAATSGAVGRPRDPRIDEAILGATRELLMEVGYSAITIEAVAKRAGVGKPTVYRRWRNKAFLAHEAVYPDIRELEIEWDTGDFASDLRRHVANMVVLFTQPEVVTAGPALLAEYPSNPELRDALWQRLEYPARAGFVSMTRAAQERGQARSDLDPDTLFDVMAGSVLWRACTFGLDVGGTFERHLTDLLLGGVLP